MPKTVPARWRGLVESYEQVRERGDVGITAPEGSYHGRLLIRCPHCGGLDCIPIATDQVRKGGDVWELRSQDPVTLYPSVRSVFDPGASAQTCHYTITGGLFTIHDDSTPVLAPRDLG